MSPPLPFIPKLPSTTTEQSVWAVLSAIQSDYQLASQQLPDSEIATKAQLNRLYLLVKTNQLEAAQHLWEDLSLERLTPSRTSIYAKIDLARNLACLHQKLEGQKLGSQMPSWQEIDRLLETAVREAKSLEDTQSLSYALGNRGGLYEYLARKYNQPQFQRLARQLTEEALLLAQPSAFPSIAYQWQWQLGRLWQSQGEREQAIAAYREAVATLNVVRGDLLTTNTDVQFSFRDNVEPVYRQLVDLLLQADTSTSPQPKELASAVALIDSLQLAELENFLRCNLLPADQNPSDIATAAESAAFIYPIVLEDRLAVIFKLPGQPLGYYVNTVPRPAVEETLKRLRRAIARRNPETEDSLSSA